MKLNALHEHVQSTHNRSQLLASTNLCLKLAQSTVENKN